MLYMLWQLSLAGVYAQKAYPLQAHFYTGVHTSQNKETAYQLNANSVADVF